MPMTYDKRNRENIDKLADNTKVKALQWYQYCLDNNIDVLIYETIRTKQTQQQYVAKGVSKTMRSYHLVGQALDFVPVVNGKTDWNKNTYARKPYIDSIEYAEKIGFESGYRWGWDAPHLQFNYKGYGTDTFGKKPTVSVPIKNGGLTVDQYNELKKEIAEIKKLILGDGNEPSKWSEQVWNKKVKEGYFDKNNPNPKGMVTREQAAILIDRIVTNIDKYKIEKLKNEIEILKQK